MKNFKSNLIKYHLEVSKISKHFFKWILIGSVVGSITGVFGALFLKSLEWATNTQNSNPWLLFLLPLAGSLVSFIYYKYGKNSIKGNNLIIEKINDTPHDIPLRMAPLVFMGTVITHLFGGSAGREGTGVQIGSSIAEAVGKLFKLDKYDTRIILMSGISSGFSSVFGTPLAATIFGLEVSAFGLVSYEALIPCFTASIVGDLVTTLLGVTHTKYAVSGIPALTFTVLCKIIFVAIIFGLVSRLFSQLTHKLKDIFSTYFKNPAIKSFVGGILIILFVFIFRTREFLGLGLPLLSDAFNEKVSIFAFAGKILFTSVTLGAGFQGGEVTPLFVIGSTLGNALSALVLLSPAFLAALGLIGVFTGATNTPIAAFILGIEMFGSEGAIFIFTVCIVSYIFSGHTGIYSSQRIGRIKSKQEEDTKDNLTISTYNKQ